MDGKISKKGILSIKRAGIYVEVHCPPPAVSICHESCAMFGEPEFKPLITTLALCDRVLEFTDLIDERC